MQLIISALNAPPDYELGFTELMSLCTTVSTVEVFRWRLYYTRCPRTNLISAALFTFRSRMVFFLYKLFTMEPDFLRHRLLPFMQDYK
jgi:hypothetical protein